MSTPARLANWNAAHPPPGTITTAGLQRATGLSYRQIDYWCRMGWLPTLTEEGGGSGYARMFDERLVPAVRLAVRARALGAPVADACAPIVFWSRSRTSSAPPGCSCPAAMRSSTGRRTRRMAGGSEPDREAVPDQTSRREIAT